MVVLGAEAWREVARRLFLAAGASEANATRVAESLVDASLAGHDSHGVIRIIQYLDAIEAGHLDPAAEPRVVREGPCFSHVDGAWTFGQVGADLCMRRAISQARSQGVAVAGLFNAYHIGRLGEYSEMAQRAGMIGMVLAGGFGGVGGSAGAGVAPYGGAKAAFGTNPISFGVPGGETPGAMVDFATSAVAGGKISLARAKGAQLPPNCILDKDGRPSTNPEDFYDGGVLTTFGGHKGYGLAVVCELLGQALTGGDLCTDERLGGGVYTRSGSLFLAMDPGLFRPLSGYKEAADAALRRIKAVPPAPGFDEVLLPGEPEIRSRERRLAEGIPLPDVSWKRLLGQAARYGVDLASLVG